MKITSGKLNRVLWNLSTEDSESRWSQSQGDERKSKKMSYSDILMEQEEF
jgi:hypothetical protein